MGRATIITPWPNSISARPVSNNLSYRCSYGFSPQFVFVAAICGISKNLTVAPAASSAGSWEPRGPWQYPGTVAFACGYLRQCAESDRFWAVSRGVHSINKKMCKIREGNMASQDVIRRPLFSESRYQKLHKPRNSKGMTRSLRAASSGLHISYRLQSMFSTSFIMTI